MKQVIVIGGGAAGMMAAIRAAQKGHQVTLLDKNEKLGKKIYITGKGRCNLTNGCDTQDLFGQVLRNPKFLYSAFYTFSNWQTVDFFNHQGMPTKVERGERVFPVSDHASDVIAALRRALDREGVSILLHTQVSEILTQESQGGRSITGVRLLDGRKLSAQAVILATGGCSYPTTGSTGDGYTFAKSLGHSVVQPMPALVPFDTKEDWTRELQGLSLRNVEVAICRQEKLLYQEFGEMLFTHFGVSGPLILSASSVVGQELTHGPLSMYIDLKPALSQEQLDRRLLREFQANQNKALKNALQSLFPAKLLPVFIALSQISGDRKVHEITREERLHLINLIKGLPVTITGLRGFSEAIITRGGVNVREVDPSTMESKLVRGLHFAGEVLDLDAMTGGFNLQIAWSTGYLAGEGISEQEEEI